MPITDDPLAPMGLGGLITPITAGDSFELIVGNNLVKVTAINFDLTIVDDLAKSAMLIGRQTFVFDDKRIAKIAYDNEPIRRRMF